MLDKSHDQQSWRPENMWKKSVAAIALLTTHSLGAARVRANPAPTGWFLAGSHPASYNVGRDTATKYSGKASGFLRSNTSKEATSGFGTIMQNVVADSYAGKRLRLSGFVKSDKVVDWAGLWMRVDGKGAEPLAFDNMQQRAIKGSNDWQRFDVVLDVDPGATSIAFGVLLAGSGGVWFDDLKFEIVPSTVAITAGTPIRSVSKTAQNLGFEQE
jgi:hypothetical protein